MGKYDDMLELPHHVSRKRPQMSVENRAAQFAPFAALTGYEDCLRETRRRTSKRIELEEEEKRRLDEKLQELLRPENKGMEASFVYFVEDLWKEGGEYITKQGVIKKVDNYRRVIVLADLTEIPVRDVLEIAW